MLSTLRNQQTLFLRSALFWACFIFIAFSYCGLLSTFVLKQAIDWRESFFWVVREWWLWAFITPFVFIALTASNNNRSPTLRLVVKIALISLTLIAMYRLSIAHFVDGDVVTAVAVDRLPKHIIALGFVLFSWYLFDKNEQRFMKKETLNKPCDNVKKTREDDVLIESKSTNTSKTITVTKGTLDVPLQVEQIVSLVSARNYVEVYTRNDTYLVRSTLKLLIDKLPQNNFIQVHRSNIVNIETILNVRKQRSGHAMLTLNNGQQLNVSKRYLSSIKAAI